MTRRARGRGASARRLSALGGSCLVASWLWLVSCNSSFVFEALTENEGGADNGGRSGSYGGYGFGESYGYGGLTGGFGFGNGGATGSAAHSGMGTDGNSDCDRKCAAAGLKCQDSSNRCVECLGPNDCTGGLTCETDPRSVVANRCVVCVDNGDCGDNQFCSDTTHTCVWQCDEENQGQCALVGVGLECSTLSGFCAGCFGDPTCENPAFSHCLGKVRCGECSENSDCDGGFCDPVLFKCVECRASRDCKDGKLCNRNEHVCQVVTPI